MSRLRENLILRIDDCTKKFMFKQAVLFCGFFKRKSLFDEQIFHMPNFILPSFVVINDKLKFSVHFSLFP
jgi:hypothetical protein